MSNKRVKYDNYIPRRPFIRRGPRSLNRRYKTPKTKIKTGLGFPLQMVMRHKYHAFFPMTSNAGGQANYSFWANGMYDPDYTGTGHQPMYFDQMCALYDHYAVTAAKITIRVSGDTVNQGSSVISCFINDDTTTTPSLTLDSIQENSTAKYFQLSAGNNDGVKTMVLYWNAKKAFGQSVVANPNFQGTSAANPVEASYFTISLLGLNAASVVVNVDVMIEYTSTWTELRDIGGS